MKHRIDGAVKSVSFIDLFPKMLRLIESYACRGARGLTLAMALLASCCGSTLAHADCRPTAEPAAVVLPLAPVQITVPLNAPVGTRVGSTHATIVSDIPFTCNGPKNMRELRISAPADVSAGLGKVYTTNLPGIGFRITTRGGNFAGIDDGPRDAAYSVPLPAHANRLTGFAVDIDFVTTGAAHGGVLAPGKLASLVIGGTTFVDVIVPESGIVFVAAQCAPVAVSGQMSMGVGTMGSFTQEAAVISTGCGAVGASLVVGVEQGYVYGAHPPVNVDATHRQPAHNASGLGAFDTALRSSATGTSLRRNRNSASDLLLDDSQSSSSDAVATMQGSSFSGSGSSVRMGSGGGMGGHR